MWEGKNGDGNCKEGSENERKHENDDWHWYESAIKSKNENEEK